jgi:hypothetical protein
MGVIPVRAPDKRSGPEGPPRLAAAKQTSTRIVPDRWNARRRAAARELERLAPLAIFYGSRPLRAVPLGQVLAEGRWAG